MMELALPDMILLPVAATLGALFAVWAYYGAREAGERVRLSRERIYRCTVCRHVYVDLRDVPLSRCPRCGCLNEAVRR